MVAADTENDIFGHNSAIIAHICTKFDTNAENGVSDNKVRITQVNELWLGSAIARGRHS